MSDELKHKAEEGLGKAKEVTGDVTGNDSLKAEGQADQAESALKQVGDKIQDAAEEIGDKAKDAFDAVKKKFS